ARQRRQERTISGKPLLPGLMRIFGWRPGRLRREFREESFQPCWVNQVLRLRETTQTHGVASAQFASHARELTGCGQGTRGLKNRVDQTKEEQAQVMRELKFS